ncbi:hypothetical protein NDU88_005217 [Pleurodeles waltl]|uniref:Uncharacterized protein n=1 Tax=Pleurodeles waltl TaxID=8319 RepID=A0AAV7PF27_PLEWA|nr:hypothetical protein NDU88_005217 [Pleurodeles waltl]
MDSLVQETWKQGDSWWRNAQFSQAEDNKWPIPKEQKSKKQAEEEKSPQRVFHVSSDDFIWGSERSLRAAQRENPLFREAWNTASEQEDQEKLLFGRQSRSLLHMAREEWEQEEDDSRPLLE